MVMETVEGSHRFNWTEGEKALLLRTLRVNYLGEDRLDVDTYGDHRRFLRNVIFAYVGGIILLGPLYWFGARMVPEGLQINPLLWGLVSLLTLQICFAVTLPFLPIQPTARVTLFPGTPWCIRHGAGQDSLERLEIASPDNLRRLASFPVLPFGQDFHGTSLTARLSASYENRMACGDLIEAKCNVVAEAPSAPPERVAQLVDEELVRTPLALHRDLRRYLNLQSLTSNRIVLQGGHTSMIWSGAVLLINLPMFIGPGAIWGEQSIVLADAVSPWRWRLLLVAIFWILAIVQTQLLARYFITKRRGTVVFDKHDDHLSLHHRGRESRIPASEFKVGIDHDVWQSNDTERDSYSLFLKHHAKVIMRWVLYTEPVPAQTREQAKALEHKVLEYFVGTSPNTDM
jgi:hypothetical protein